MKPFYCRVGSKRKFSSALVKLFPPHETYVEAFLGGGAVFFEKEPSKKEIINDLDSKLIRDYKLLQKAPSEFSSYKIVRGERNQNAFLNQKHTSVADRIVEALLRRCNGFGGAYIEEGSTRKVFVRRGSQKTTTHESKLRRIADYKKRINQATLTNESYESVFRKHDGASSFFFLDPPYEMSVGLDYAKGSERFDFEKFRDEVSKLKGKFLITINDSPYIRKVFKGFNIYKYVVEGHHSKGSKIGSKDRKELLITNYELPKQWKKTLKGGVRGGRDVAQIIEAVNELIVQFQEGGQLRQGYCVPFSIMMIHEYLDEHRFHTDEVVQCHSNEFGVRDADLDRIMKNSRWEHEYFDFRRTREEWLAKMRKEEAKIEELRKKKEDAKTHLEKQTIEAQIQNLNRVVNGYEERSAEDVQEMIDELETFMSQGFPMLVGTNVDGQGHVYSIIPVRNEAVGAGGGTTFTYVKVDTNGFIVDHNYTIEHLNNEEDLKFVYVIQEEPLSRQDVRLPLYNILSVLVGEDANEETIRAELAKIDETVLTQIKNDLISFRGMNFNATPLKTWASAAYEYLKSIFSELEPVDEETVFLINTIRNLVNGVQMVINGRALFLSTGARTNEEIAKYDAEAKNTIQNSILSRLSDFVLNNTAGKVIEDYALLITGYTNPDLSVYTPKELLSFLKGIFKYMKLTYGVNVDDDGNIVESEDSGYSAGEESMVEEEAQSNAAPGAGQGSGKTHRENVLKKYGLKKKSYSLEELAKVSGVPLTTLQEVYNRGIGAYKTNPESVRMKGSFKKGVDAPMSKKLSKEQWAMARVYSFLDGNEKHDTDLRGEGKQYRSLNPYDPVKYNSLKEVRESDYAYLVGKRQELMNLRTQLGGLTISNWLDHLVVAYELAEVQSKLTKVIDALFKISADPARGIEDWGVSKPGLYGSGIKQQLGKLVYSPDAYLKEIRRKAKKHGYDPASVDFSDDDEHKLQIRTPEGKLVRFGRAGYGDFLIWSYLEKKGKAPKGIAERKQNVFRISHSAIKGDWKKDKYSPNNLALNLLW